jgi:hypothetical protein
MSFTFEPVPGKPGAFRVWREGDEQPWHPDQMLDRYLERKETQMIDPRKAPVAMLPTLNAIAGHMIAHAAPLRIINVEDTEQMITEAMDHSGIDPEEIEEELKHLPTGLLDFHAHTHWITLCHRSREKAGMTIEHNSEVFLNCLKALVEDAV